MSKFTHFVQSDVQDDTLSLEIWRGEAFEIVVTLFLDDKLEITLGDQEKTYSSSELVEILEMVVPFAINTAGINDSVRKMDEERRKEREGQ